MLGKVTPEIGSCTGENGKPKPGIGIPGAAETEIVVSFGLQLKLTHFLYSFNFF